MNKILSRSFLAGLFAFASITNYGQVSQGGTPRSFFLKSSLDIPRIWISEPEQSVLTEETIYPYRIAVGNEVSINVPEKGSWEILPGEGRICRLNLRAEGAKALHLLFEEYALPDGAELFIYDPARKNVLGAYTSFNNKTSGKLAIQAFPGEELILEYFEPFDVSFPAALSIGNVGYNYRENSVWGLEGFGDSERCNRDINCSTGNDWQVLKRSVCRISYQKANGSWFLCTGALINNARSDGTPYFLTANHCVSSNTEAESIILYFNYESPSCNGPDGPSDQTVSGSKIVATTYRLDFSLVELDEKPPLEYNPYYAGWDARDEPASGVASIHHPAGDVKKISTYSKAVVTDDFTYLYDYDDYSHWYIADWTIGVTEGGSSGAPLFNGKKQIIGDLTGGSQSCNCTSCDSYYAKLSDSWAKYPNPGTQLRHWLDPDSTGVMDIGGYDPAWPVSEEKVREKPVYRVYPNPAGEFLYIQPGAGPGSVFSAELIDQTGRIVYSEQHQAAGIFRISLSEEWEGLYLLRLADESGTVVKKVLIR